MLRLTLAEIAQALDYQVFGDGAQIIAGLAIDSRQVKEDDLFVAIKGEHTDGHQFLAKAFENGAKAVVISDKQFVDATFDGLLVDDGLRFIQRLANYIRQKTAPLVIAITGSSGKTTTKDMLFNVLSQQFQVVATKGNHNNELGLPLTLCAIDETTQIVIVEMGMRGLGQIDFLCQIAQPDYGIITNIGTVHAELLGSQENIAQAKAELLSYLLPNGLAVLNKADDKFLKLYTARCQSRICWCALEKEGADIWAENIIENEIGAVFTCHIGEEQEILQLVLNGDHNVQNALAVISVAKRLGLPWSIIQEGLLVKERSVMRMEEMRNSFGALIINDVYNANPQSVLAALKVLTAKKGSRKIAVLGDMYELGQYEEESHRDIGRKAMDLGIDVLITVGALGKLIAQGALSAKKDQQFIYQVQTNKEAAGIIKSLQKSDDVFLVKGSRGMKMEEIIEEIMG